MRDPDLWKTRFIENDDSEPGNGDNGPFFYEPAMMDYEIYSYPWPLGLFLAKPQLFFEAKILCPSMST